MTQDAQNKIDDIYEYLCKRELLKIILETNVQAVYVPVFDA